MGYTVMSHDKTVNEHFDDFNEAMQYQMMLENQEDDYEHQVLQDPRKRYFLLEDCSDRF